MAQRGPRVSAEHFDVVIVGAGLSGVGAACHLGAECPGKTFVLLEAREQIGGTWDLFRYPGVRSDSDMFTLAYSFKPWRGKKSIAGGASILDYIRDTAREHGVERHIRFRHRVGRIAWSSETARWTIEAERGAAREPVRFTCNFLMMCAGYYSYAAGYAPEFAGIARFRGAVVHPQNWTDKVDYRGKRVVVIGSGATAVTLIPEIAKEAAHVTMLQRSPTYVVAWPDEDAIANGLRRLLPLKLASALTRWKNILRLRYFYGLAKRKPERLKKLILAGVRAALGPDETLKHFTPRYNPWDQRLCLTPNGDLFRSIREGRTSVVTGAIDTFTETGIALKSGEKLEADLVVTATGLDLLTAGGAEMTIDGRPIEPASLVSYKGAMYADVPNFVAVFGYTNASWTLKADLIARFACRLINHMDRHGYRTCTPRSRGADIGRAPFVDFTSGYFARALATLPKQGAREPWRVHQDYVKDLIAFRYRALDDGVMEFV
jgi:cation diffusion facilitator CzcD-associated flavoprotein CzcO